jgi:hypothetical protein
MLPSAGLRYRWQAQSKRKIQSTDTSDTLKYFLASKNIFQTCQEVSRCS